jgi:hypothetical protein
MGWLGRGLGSFGAQAGEASEINLDYRAKQQQMQLEAARQKLQELMMPLQMQELQARLKEMTQPKPAGLVGTRGGGQAGVTFEPGKGYSLQTLESGADPEAVKGQIGKMKQGAPKEYQAALQSHIDAIDAGADPMKELDAAQKDMSTSAAKTMPTGSAQNRALSEAMDAYARGDMATYAAKLKEVGQMSSATKSQSPTMWNTIAAAQQGDPDAVARLKKYTDMQKELVRERGLAFGQGRLYAMNNYWVDGVPGAMTGFEAENAKREGHDVQYGGGLNANTRIAYQQLYAEAGPAISAVERDLPAFDNPTDRAIFAKILGSAGAPAPGDEVSWFRNWSAQALKSDSGLSKQGRQLTADIARLGETMGRFRGVAGLPATESSMGVTMMLVPGPTTPDAEYGGMQLNILKNMIMQAGGIPAIRGSGLGPLNFNQPTIPPPPGFTQKVGP